MLRNVPSDPSVPYPSASRAVVCPRCGMIYPGDTPRCPADGTPLGLSTSASELAMQALPEPGTRVQNYRLIQVLGEGSMGRVYLARNEAIGRVVALKMLHPTLLENRSAIEHFINEARTVNQIRHPNIIEISDFLMTEDGSGCFLVMERLDGTTLDQLLRVAAPLSIGRALRIGEQICSALAAAHRVGVIHRDLKPDNVFLLERDGTKDFVKLIDFGVATVIKRAKAEGGGPTSGKPDRGYLVGTPAYMSPEQTLGGNVDYRSDIYAVGVLLYEMVTGQLPFGGRTLQELLEAHCYQPPPPPSQQAGPGRHIPPVLENLILHCLAKSAADRPRTMESVRQSLCDIREGLSEEAQVPFDTLGGVGTTPALFDRPLGGAPNQALGDTDDDRWDMLLDPSDPRFGELPPDDALDERSLRPPRRIWPIALAMAALLGIGYAGYAMVLKYVSRTEQAAPSEPRPQSATAEAHPPAATTEDGKAEPGEPSSETHEARTSETTGQDRAEAPAQGRAENRPSSRQRRNRLSRSARPPRARVEQRASPTRVTPPTAPGAAAAQPPESPHPTETANFPTAPAAMPLPPRAPIPHTIPTSPDGERFDPPAAGTARPPKPPAGPSAARPKARSRSRIQLPRWAAPSAKEGKKREDGSLRRPSWAD
jgi:serine/threonine protein kinase